MLAFWLTIAFFFVLIALLLADSARRAEQQAARREQHARRAFAESPCPACGALVGDTAAAAISAASRRAAEQAIHDGMAEGLRVNPRRDWFGPCPSCGEGLSFNPRTRTVGLDASA